MNSRLLQVQVQLPDTLLQLQVQTARYSAKKTQQKEKTRLSCPWYHCPILPASVVKKRHVVIIP